MFEIFKLVLDDSDFTKKLGDANKLIGSIGAGDSLKGLVDNLKLAGGIAIELTLAYKAVKSAIDWVEEAEEIKAVTNEFNLLGQQAGIATDRLQKGLIDAAGGLIDDTDLLKSANKAIVEMGASASKLPEIMEVARKSTAVFGGDLSTNFETLNRAIATGNERMLKGLGIVIDSQKAQKDYAASIGTVAGTLSQEEKQQATLLAVIEKGKTAFQGIDINAREASNTIQKMMVNLKSIWETVVIVIDKAIGPLVRQGLTNINVLLEETAKKFKQAFGTENASEKVETLSEKLHKAQADLFDVNNEIEKFGGKAPEALTRKAEQTKKTIEELRAQLHGAMDEAGTLKTPDKDKDPKQEQDKRRQQEEAFQADLLKIKESSIQRQIANNEIEYSNEYDLFGRTKSMYDAKIENEKLASEQISLLRQEEANKLKQIEDDKKFTSEQSQRLRLETTKQYESQITQIEKTEDKKRLDDRKSTYSTIATLSRSSNATLATIGKAAGVVQIAIDTPVAISKALAAFPPPFNFAAAGLVAAAMAEQAAAIAGIGGGGGGATGGGGFSGGGSFGAESSPALNTDTQQQQRERKQVVVAFNGPVINTEQTRQWMADTIRANIDATDFRVTELGI